MVVVDAPATGHGLALLEAPRTFANAAQVGPIARQGRRIAVTLRDRSVTALVAVATPEQAAVDELLTLRAALGQLDAVLANAVTPARFSDSDATALREAHARPELAPATRDALAVAIAAAAQARAEQLQLARLGPRVELPFLAAAQLSVTDLEALADRLVTAA